LRVTESLETGIPVSASERIREAGSLVVLTGAGISAESGVPTFRGNHGLWKERRSVELATPQAFERDPDLVWEWYHWRRKVVQGAFPNPAHNALVELENRIRDFTLITQNVDGMHHRAGSRNVLEIHGNIHRARCTACPWVKTLGDENGIIRCRNCGERMRPDVVWFGENLDPLLLEKAFSASGRSDFTLVAGTSGVVQPAASLAYRALSGGSYVLEVNLEATPLTGTATATVLGKAGDILPELIRLAYGQE
jgi:NAD-dependent deacetylase